MKTHPRTLRTAALALFASAAFVNAPVFGQAAPVVAPPSPVQAAPPPPVAATPPLAIAPTPAPTPRAAPAAPEARQTARQAPRAPQRSARTASRPAPASAAPAAPTPETAPAAPVPAPAAEAAPAPVAQPVPAAPAQAAGEAAIADGESSTLLWLVAAGLALVIGLAGFLLWRRRRSAEEDSYYEEPAYQEPAIVAEPPAPPASDYQPTLVTPAFRPAESAPVLEPEVTAAITAVELSEADPADVEALATGSPAHGDRPWLEMLMRPIRAGATGDDTVVEFSLTVGNTGGVPAEDVRISAWMLASGEGSEMEGLLIDPPAGAILSETRIEAGDGATVEATVALPRDAIDSAMLPVVVTDARYSLPDGGEGRTSASFAIGMPIGEELVPFPANPASGLNDGIEARVHGDVEHV